MLKIFSQAMLFIIIICIGYILKSIGIFRKEDFRVISKIVIYLTLPCSIINNFSSLEFESNLLILILLGFIFTVILSFIGLLMTKNKGIKQKQFNMINLSGYNIGCFTIPFAQSFLGPLSVVAICLFDTGNSIMVTGGNYIWAKTMAGDNEEKNKIKYICKMLVKSPPLVCYTILITLQLLNISLPNSFLNLTNMIGGSNAFLSMLMIGIGFELHFNKEQIKLAKNILSIRFLVAIIFAIFVYFLMPFTYEVKFAVILAIFSPIASLAPVFTERLDGDVALASTINSLCILISLVCITILLMFM